MESQNKKISYSTSQISKTPTTVHKILYKQVTFTKSAHRRKKKNLM
jgi:hypothetical protein